MVRILRSHVSLALVAVLLVMGCSSVKMPETMQAVPGDADIVITLDAKPLIAYAKQTMTKLVPAEMKDKVPAFETLAKQVMQMVGIDLNKLSKITFIGYVGSEEKMAVLAEGVDISALKGEKKGDHNGVSLYAMPHMVHYAELKGLGVVAGPSEEMIKKVLDANSGKGKRLADTDRAKIMKELLGMEKNLDQFRAYLLTGDLPDAKNAPFTLKGGGFFMHLDKGAAGTLMSDESGASNLKTQLDMAVGMMAVAGAGDLGAGMEMDEETKKLIGDVMKNLKTDKSGSSVSISYHGDLKPLIEKAVAMSMLMLKEPEVPPAAPPAVAPAPEPAPEPTEAPAKPKAVKK